MFPADIKSDIVLRLCKGISESDVRLVPLHPLANKPLNECFSIVPEHIEKHGGSQVIGWAVWEWPKVLIEAEFQSSIGESTIADFERGVREPMDRTLRDIRVAFETAGIKFINDGEWVGVKILTKTKKS